MSRKAKVEQWSASRTDLDSFTFNPETGETEHVVYVYRGDDDKKQRIPIFGRDNRKDAALIASAPELQRRVAKLEGALIRLRDCDWVITPHDRMDAVRQIAREALEGEK